MGCTDDDTRFSGQLTWEGLGDDVVERVEKRVLHLVQTQRRGPQSGGSRADSTGGECERRDGGDCKGGAEARAVVRQGGGKAGVERIRCV